MIQLEQVQQKNIMVQLGSNSNSLNTARSELSGCGTQTAGLAFGGAPPAPGTSTGATEEYDGNSWTNSNSLNTIRRSIGAAGTQTAALSFGGWIPGLSSATEEYDG
jgi:hypothetical protein